MKDFEEKLTALIVVLCIIISAFFIWTDELTYSNIRSCAEYSSETGECIKYEYQWTCHSEWSHSVVFFGDSAEDAERCAALDKWYN